MKSCGDLSLGTLFLQLQLRSMVLAATANPSEDMEDFAMLLPLRLINTTTEQVLSYASQQGFALSGQVIAILMNLRASVMLYPLGCCGLRDPVLWSGIETGIVF